MEKFYTTFEGFVQHKIHKKEQLQEQGQFPEAPPDENDAPWHYPHEDELDIEVTELDLPEYFDELRKNVSKSAIYGQLMGLYLGSIIQRYADYMAREDWEEIMLFAEEQVFYNPTSRNIADDISEIEARLAAKKLESESKAYN